MLSVTIARATHSNRYPFHLHLSDYVLVTIKKKIQRDGMNNWNPNGVIGIISNSSDLSRGQWLQMRAHVDLIYLQPDD